MDDDACGSCGATSGWAPFSYRGLCLKCDMAAEIAEREARQRTRATLHRWLEAVAVGAVVALVRWGLAVGGVWPW